MNSTNFFLILIFFFSFEIVSYAQVEQNLDDATIVLTTEETTEPTEKIAADQRTNTILAESNITTTTSSFSSEDFAFYFNHKQFMRPIVRKTALC